MKVFYHEGKVWTLSPPRPKNETTILALSFNNWDDYGISTTFNAVLYHEKKSVFEFNLKIFIEGDIYTPRTLNQLRESGWDGYFPIPGKNYISVPSDIEFYDALISVLGKREAIKVLQLVRDAGYLTNIIHDDNATQLTRESNFAASPLREAGARKSFTDGWKVFESTETTKIEDFTLYTPSKTQNGVDAIRFTFNSTTLPYDINVLIGPNGAGKSYTLKKLAEYWLGLDSGSLPNLRKSNHKPFDTSPNISKMIVISYSPFEDFILNLEKTNLKDKSAYKYFGFRRKSTSSMGVRQSTISRNLPASDSVESIFKAFEDDIAFGYLNTWTSKIDTIRSVLKPALGFDEIALAVVPDLITSSLLRRRIFSLGDEKQYLILNEDTYSRIERLAKGELNPLDLTEKTEGVVFIKDGGRLNLSSGQRLFVYMVINIVGQIRSESLVIVDEPELFLHPTFEVEFIALLKKVLDAFNSKAVLATHSLAIAREIPASCMHVYRESEAGLEIDHPPFETFGGDMQRLSSYVFGDHKIEKPFAQWIKQAVRKEGDPDKLIKKLKGELNEEMMIRILNAGADNGR